MGARGRLDIAQPESGPVLNPTDGQISFQNTTHRVCSCFVPSWTTDEMERQAPITSETSPLGLSCTLSGVWLAGIPLLQHNEQAFSVRPKEQIAELLKSAYGGAVSLNGVMAGLDVVAKAISGGDLGRALVASALLRLPALDWDRASRMSRTEDKLAQYSEGERRDWHGKWTTGSSASPQNRTSPLRPAPSRPASGRSAAAAPLLALTPTRAAVAAEVVGGGPEDPVADLAASAALVAGFLMSVIGARRSRPGATSGRRSYSPIARQPDEDECEELLNKDMINCQIVKATKGRQKGAQCREVATQRYSECLRGGLSNVRTPFYWGN
jgi:hypothetical protein